MTDELRKLLAGYATNTLTETERKSLFEASLNDQELFDALHEEQVLKDLLDDPASRAQIRQALDGPHPAPTRAWWTRWWAWTSATTAVAATVITVAVVTRQPVSAPAPPPAVASVKTSPERLKPTAPAQDTNGLTAPSAMRAHAARARTKPKDEIALASRPAPGLADAPARPAAAPPPPPPASFSAQQQVEVLPAQQSQNQIVGGVVGGVIGSQESKLEPLSFALLKRDNSGTYLPLTPNSELQPGDAVRITVVPDTSGYLSLSREGPTGNWILVFPKSSAGIPVAANESYTIPDGPIEVQDTGQRFRLILVSGPTIGLETKSVFKAKSSAVAKKQEQSPNAPLVLDFTISPRTPR